MVSGRLIASGRLIVSGRLTASGRLNVSGRLTVVPAQAGTYLLKNGAPAFAGATNGLALPELQPLYRSFNLFTGAPTSLTGASTWLPRPEADLLADLEIAAEVAAVPGAQGLHADAVAGGDGAQ